MRRRPVPATVGVVRAPDALRAERPVRRRGAVALYRPQRARREAAALAVAGQPLAAVTGRGCAPAPRGVEGPRARRLRVDGNDDGSPSR